MWLMLQHHEPDDFVVATNETHTIRELLDVAFARVNLDWNDYVEIDKRYFRPTEVPVLLGDCSKAATALNWTPETSFRELVEIMVDSDMKLAAREQQLPLSAEES